jgi:hypothetical protein
VAGILNRVLTRDGSDGVEDYDLGRIRMLQAIQFSGISAVLGVIVTVYATAIFTDVSRSAPPSAATPAPAAAVTPSPTPAGTSGTTPAPSSATLLPHSATGSVPRLRALFDLDTFPLSIVIAAIFGLTPLRLIGRLEATASQIKADIRSAEAK